MCAALVFALALLWALGAALSPRPEPPAEPPSPAAVDGRVVAWFGSSTDPFCAPLFDAMEKTCRANGWRLISYDCKGRAVGQIEDFLRTEQADAAVVYSVMEEDELDTQTKALAAVCPVVTVGRKAGASARRYVTVHIGGEDAQRVSLLGEYLAERVEAEQGALLITSSPDKPTEQAYIRGFSEKNVTILDNNYDWDGARFAVRYLNTALETYPGVGAVVCTNRFGTTGTSTALKEWKMRDAVEIVSLFYDPAMADDLALGELDAAVAFAPKEAAEKLDEVLPAVVAGKETEDQTLTPVLLTPENVDETELGYE